MLHAFTVDVEDYFHVSGFADRIRPDAWGDFACRVEESARRALRLLERRRVLGTFFILGWVAQHYPQLVREIADAGHEIGCHSQWHRLVYDLSPDEFRADLVESRDRIEQLVGVPVVAFRAPSFSITRRSLWALDILAEERFTLDASIFPVRHDRYGMPGSPTAPYLIKTQSGVLREFPGTTVPIAGRAIPVGGGGYLRLYPAAVTAMMLRRVERAGRRRSELSGPSGRPFNVYVHPWEFDPDQPRLPAKRLTRFRHYVGLKSTEAKLERLLKTFHFDTMTAALNAWELKSGPLPTLTPAELAETAGHSVGMPPIRYPTGPAPVVK